MSRQQLQKYGTTFHFAGQFLSNSQLEIAAELYGICRELDDIADSTSDISDARQRLMTIRSDICSSTISDPISKRIHQLPNTINRPVICELIDGIASDTGLVRITTKDELYRYCYQVAGTVGLLMCDIFDVTDHIARHHAVDLGIAMQLTNICRDVLEDAQNNRRYLPSELIGDVNPPEIHFPTEKVAVKIQEIVATLLVEADIRYESGFTGLPFLPIRVRYAILIAGLSYREIGNVLIDRGLNLWIERAFTTKATKTMIALRGLITVMSSIDFHRYRGTHDASLHRGLESRPGVHWAA